MCHPPRVANNSDDTRLAGSVRGGTVWRLRAGAITLGLLSATACSENQPTEPPVSVIAAQGVEACSGRDCILATGVKLFQAARFHPDSVHLPVPIGVVEVSGVSGASIVLVLGADLRVLRSLGSKARVLVEANGATKAVPLADLKSGVTVYTFSRGERVRIKYSLERAVAAPVARGQVALVQQLTGSATLVSAQRRWILNVNQTLALQSIATCAITGPTTTACDNTVTTSPYAPSEYSDPGATFQSNSGFGASQPISISFAKPVGAVTITIFDSDCSNNQMIAYDAAGLIVGSLTFSFDNQPGNGAITDARTITAPVGSLISRVRLVPDPCEYVAYSGSWEPPPCPPSGDPVLDAREVRTTLLQSLALSQPNSAPALRQRRERGGLIYLGADGLYHAVEGFDPLATVCDYSHARGQVTLQPGDSVVAGFHTHPHKTNDPIYDDCSRVPPGRSGRASPSAKGGGSDADWDNATSSGFKEYVITNDGIISRLDPNTPRGSSRLNNKNRWTFNASNQASCFTKIP